MKKDLNDREKIALAALVVLGRDYLPTAFAMSHPQAKTTSEASLKVMHSRWYASPLCKEFREEVKQGILGVAVADGNDLTTRDGIVSELIKSVKQSNGKEAIGGLQTLAKLQGFDRPEEKKEDERRTYVLRWLSKCRSCELMKLFIKVQEENQ
ncbi:MAG: hypothetical protein IKS94_01045 [Prevotella sp.]|nr:hypothetical protein [Prevotella sp.]